MAEDRHVVQYDGTSLDQLLASIPGKASKAVPAAAGNLAALDVNGNLVDSEKQPTAAGIGAAPRYASSIGGNSYLSISFTGRTAALIVIRGEEARAYAAFLFSSYTVGGTRGTITTLSNMSSIAISLNSEDVINRTHGVTLQNLSGAGMDVSVVMLNGNATPVFESTSEKAMETPYVEYNNPPTQLGVEYRTTERWNGKAVYTKLVNFGEMPNSTSSSVAHGISGITQVIRCVGQNITLQQTIPSNWNGRSTECYADKNACHIHTTADSSAHTAYIQIWYIKD